MTTKTEKIVYDFGANNGSNIPYYLLKFDKIIAIEANPQLADYISNQYSQYIKNERLFVENCVVSKENNYVNFYIHKSNDVLSQFHKPENLDEFYKINVISSKPSEIVKKYGEPEYIKIDVEHLDADILSELFSANIFPNYISAEVHHMSVFDLLTNIGLYDSFKILDGKSVSEIYNNVDIDGTNYSFPFHSAGPMFNDISQKELDKKELLQELLKVGLGWKDIHAKKNGLS